MCEYDPKCAKPVDPLAKALSENPRPMDADLLVLCPGEHHLLAAVYDLPRRGRALCTPHFRFRYGSMFKPSAVDPNRIGHMHPGLDLLEELDPDEPEFGRCRCGMRSYTVRQILEMLRAHDEGRLLPDGEMVKVRHSNGQVGKMGRAFAESHGLEIVGRARRSPELERPHILANWVKVADAP